MIKQLDNTDKNVKLLTKYLHLVDNDFGIPLSENTELESYALKLLAKGVVLVFVERNEFAGLVAGYCNDSVDGNAIISLLSTRNEYRGQGISRQLIYCMIDICHNASMKRILVDSINPSAVNIYLSCGFNIVKKETVGGRIRTFLKLQFVEQ